MKKRSTRNKKNLESPLSGAYENTVGQCHRSLELGIESVDLFMPELNQETEKTQHPIGFYVLKDNEVDTAPRELEGLQLDSSYCKCNTTTFRSGESKIDIISVVSGDGHFTRQDIQQAEGSSKPDLTNPLERSTLLEKNLSKLPMELADSDKSREQLIDHLAGFMKRANIVRDPEGNVVSLDNPCYPELLEKHLQRKLNILTQIKALSLTEKMNYLDGVADTITKEKIEYLMKNNEVFCATMTNYRQHLATGLFSREDIIEQLKILNEL